MRRVERKSCSARRQNFFKPIALAGALVMALGATQSAADAYYYPFYYRGLSNLLYPLRYATYPLFGLTGPVSSWTSASPYRLATRGLTGYPYMYGPQTMLNYQDPEPLYQPRNRVKQKRLGQEFGVDEINHAQWADGDQDARLAATPPLTVPNGYVQGATPGQLQYVGSGSPGYPGGTPGYPTGATFPTATPTQFGIPAGYSLVPNGQLPAQNGQSPVPTQETSTPPVAADGTPPTAPPLISKKRVSLAPNAHDAAPLTTPGATRAPLADGFVNHVNTQFGGNIEAALFDPSTRKYAKVLGLVSDDSLFGMDFTDTRVELIKRIFSDQSLDSVSKLGAVKILLQSTSTAPADKESGK